MYRLRVLEVKYDIRVWCMRNQSGAAEVLQDNANPSVSDPLEVSEVSSEARANGRPRSEKSMQAILDSTNKLLLHSSVRDISIESVAKKAGVGKTTIYRWWPNKVALVLDAITGPLSVLPEPEDTRDPADALVRQIERFARLCRGRGGKIIAEVYAETQGDSDLQRIFFEKFMLSHEEVLVRTLERGMANGVFRKDLHIPLCVDMIYGAFFYHLMSSPSQLDQEFVNNLVINMLRFLR